MADGTLKVGTITTSSGSGTITLGQSGETITVPSGVTMSGMGKVLQVVSATDSTQRSTTSSSFVTASNTLSVSITPSSTSSKIFVMTSFGGGCGTSNVSIKYTIYRDATNLGTSGDGMCVVYSSGSTPYMPVAMSVLDSPSSTSSLTYQVYIKSNGSADGFINTLNPKGSITAFEVSA